MPDCLKKLKRLLDELDALTEPIAEYEISGKLGTLRKECEKNSPEELFAEIIAFDFAEDYSDQNFGWGTYFGPMIIVPQKNGTIMKYPNISDITPAIIEYWSKRVKEVKNPILKARYANLVWDFSKKVTGKQPDYSIAQIAIDSIIEIAQKGLHKYKSEVIKKLECALFLALSLNDKNRIERVKKTITDYEDKIAEDDKPGLWGFSFDLLLKNKKIPLTPEQKTKIVNDLEQRLDRLSKSKNHNFWAAENAAFRLADYYNRSNRKEEANRIILKFGKILEMRAESAAAFQAAVWLKKLYSIYLQYGLKKEADRIAIKLRELGPKVDSEMKTISYSVRIPQEKVDKLTKQLIDGDLEKSLIRTANYYIPKKEEVIKQLQELSQKTSLSFLFTREILQDQGHIIATIKPLEEDIDGHVVLQISQNMEISSFFLQETIKALISKFKLDTKTIIDYLYKSPIFEEGRKPFLIRGIEAYLNGDFLVAMHLLIPQIEVLIRNLVEKTGGAVLKTSRSGGFQYKTLDELLRDEGLIKVLGEDTALYFRVLFTDPRGWNLRNNLCHGISTLETFNSMFADRVFHALLCLALLRERKGKKK